MKISVNQEPRDFPEGLTIQQLLHALTIQSTRGLAVAVDDQVVPRDRWEQHPVVEGSRITIIRATQGG